MTLMNSLTAAQRAVSSISNSHKAEPAADPDQEFDMGLLDNAKMFEQIETMFTDRELRALNSLLVEISHDMRMAVIRNIHDTLDGDSTRRLMIIIERFDYSEWRKITDAQKQALMAYAQGSSALTAEPVPFMSLSMASRAEATHAPPLLDRLSKTKPPIAEAPIR